MCSACMRAFFLYMWIWRSLREVQGHLSSFCRLVSVRLSCFSVLSQYLDLYNLHLRNPEDHARPWRPLLVTDGP